MVWQMFLGIATLIIMEILVWGTMGYFLFRLLGMNEKRWRLECLILIIAFSVFTIWDNYLLMNLDLSISNPEIITFFDNLGIDINSNEFFEMDGLDTIWVVVEVLIGYKIGKILLNKIRMRDEVEVVKT